VVHNPADPDGAYVVERSMAELAAVGVPSLHQVLDMLPTHVGLDVDLKSSLEDAVLPPERSTAALVAPILDLERHRRELLVTSFDPAALLLLRERAPQIPLGLLTWFTFPLHMAVAAAAHLGVEVIAAQVGSFRPDGQTARHRGGAHAIDVAHEAGLEVIAWCPTPAEAAELVQAGVDALVVDRVVGEAESPGRPGLPT
jgi:glycerophosphoryl diester phosphodiesterase